MRRCVSGSWADGSFFVAVCRELAELHKARASRDSEAQEAALSRETQAREQLSVTLDKAREEARLQQEALANQVTDTCIPTYCTYCSCTQSSIILLV